MYLLEKIKQYNHIDNDDNENVKLQLMASHPFIFLRGSVELFFEEISKENYQNTPFFLNKDIECWCSNDSHVTNFGFQNISCSTNEEVHYEINDFDEGFISNPFYDIIRFCSSLYYYIEEINVLVNQRHPNEFLNLCPDSFIKYFLTQYIRNLREPRLDISIKSEIFPFLAKMKLIAKEKSSSSDKDSRFFKYTVRNDNSYTLNHKNKKLEPITTKEKETLTKKLSKIYPEYTIGDIMKRSVAGVGSAHLDRYYFIMSKENKYLLMELKEQRKPVSIQYLKRYEKKYNDKYIGTSNANIQIKTIKKMIGNYYDENLHSLDYNDKSFISRTSFNAKLKISSEDLIPNDFNEEILIRNINEYIKIAAIKLSNAHFKSSKNKELFQDEVITLIKIYNEKLLGVINAIFNDTSMNYSQFLREYYLTLGNELNNDEIKDILNQSFNLSKSQSSETKKDISKK